MDAISFITGVLFSDQKTSFSQIRLRLRLRPNLSSEIRPNSASAEFEKVKFGAILVNGQSQLYTVSVNGQSQLYMVSVNDQSQLYMVSVNGQLQLYMVSINDQSQLYMVLVNDKTDCKTNNWKF